MMTDPDPSLAARKPRRTRPFEDRFWEKVAKAGPDECWLWIGTRQRAGYGTIYRDGKMRMATRMSLELHGRPYPGGRLEACHVCDNPPCVNPAHLWWGTTAENQHDSLRKGRHQKASRTHCPEGHPLSGSNLRYETTGARRCRICLHRNGRKWRIRRKMRATQNAPMSPETTP